ncbi:MAG: putative methyltransferase [Prokaryotic dsDNA virus sp.]|nr:MAG: putative methyltransferase [Prokaryotic dsDNA virus sp.]|tara:strand:+ start:394 stop:990 length:597 start_codon:yes stop_codon:yes gene_type:complete
MNNENYRFWKKVWNSKGESNSVDLLFLDGYEHLESNFSSQQITQEIINSLKINNTDRVLEVACGCGFLSREFNNLCTYVGVDYSKPIIAKHKELFKHEVYVCESNNLFFQDNSFDHVFCYGLFQYLPNIEYAEQTIAEMCRVSKNGIYLGDLKKTKTRDQHFVYPVFKLQDKDFRFSKCIHTPKNQDRFNAYKIKGEV